MKYYNSEPFQANKWMSKWNDVDEANGSNSIYLKSKMNRNEYEEWANKKTIEYSLLTCELI